MAVFLVLTVLYFRYIIDSQGICGLVWTPKHHLKYCFYKCITSFKKPKLLKSTFMLQASCRLRVVYNTVQLGL